jgi:hypothetical protein
MQQATQGISICAFQARGYNGFKIDGGKMNDKEMIVRAALDYVEGWYQADASRMKRALYTKLTKRRITPEGDAWEVDKAWMVEATGNGRGRIEYPEKGRKDVTILDMTDTIASVKLVSNEFVDYLHLTKCEDKWVIVNVLWDYVADKIS